MANYNSRQGRRNTASIHNNKDKKHWVKTNDYGSYLTPMSSYNDDYHVNLVKSKRVQQNAINLYKYLAGRRIGSKPVSKNLAEWRIGKHFGSKPVSKIKKMIKSYLIAVKNDK